MDPVVGWALVVLSSLWLTVALLDTARGGPDG